MKIYIDGFCYLSSEGVPRFYENLLTYLAEKNFEITTSIPNYMKETFIKKFSRFKNINPIFKHYIKPSINQKKKSVLRKLQFFIAFFMRALWLYKNRNNFDAFIFVDNFVRAPFYVPKNTLVVIHDIRLLVTNFSEDESKLARIFYKFQIKRALKKAKKIITSKSALEDLKKVFKFDSSKVLPIYKNYVRDNLLNYDTKERLIQTPYILFVSGRRPHKNFVRLVKAFNLINDKIPHNLVLAGRRIKNRDKLDETIEELNLSHRVIQLEPDDKQLANLYAHADLFISPSLFEGFGLTPIEAVKFNVPAILSNIPAHKENFGDSAIYFDPYDIEEMANTILKVLTNKKLKKELLRKEKERIKIFDKEKIMREYLNVITNLN